MKICENAISTLTLTCDGRKIGDILTFRLSTVLTFAFLCDVLRCARGARRVHGKSEIMNIFFCFVKTFQHSELFRSETDVIFACVVNEEIFAFSRECLPPAKYTYENKF